ncbi:hypothetical protein TNCV_1304811 [Trichonephila clavipes]|nr:hypothetical protein TNCV_1304811 [Trichonephila clavipes]
MVLVKGGQSPSSVMEPRQSCSSISRRRWCCSSRGCQDQRGQFRRPITKCCLLPTELIVRRGSVNIRRSQPHTSPLFSLDEGIEL